MRRAKDKLKIQAIRAGGIGDKGFWKWQLPVRAPTKALDASVSTEHHRRLDADQNSEATKVLKTPKRKSRKAQLNGEGINKYAQSRIEEPHNGKLPFEAPKFTEPCLNCRGKGCRCCDVQIRDNEEKPLAANRSRKADRHSRIR